MKKFLAIYMGSTSGAKMNEWRAQDKATLKERETAGMNAWIAWGKKNADAIVDEGSPLGKTKLINRSGVSDIKNLMTGYVILNAESHEAAAKLFENHPHFTLFPGESVEIMECIPIPPL